MDVESNLSTPMQRRQPNGNMGESTSNSELSSLQKEINTLREFIHAEDNKKKQPSWIRIFCSQLGVRTMQSLRFTRGLLGQCYTTSIGRIVLNFISVLAFVALLINIDNIPFLTKGPNSILRRHRRGHEDPYTLLYKGHIYRTLRPDVEVDSFENSYLRSGRSVLTCPVRFPVPNGWTLVPEDDVADVFMNVVSTHYWSSSAMVLNKFAAYPTMSLSAQVITGTYYTIILTSLRYVALRLARCLTSSFYISCTPRVSLPCRWLVPIHKQQMRPRR
jgi:hypothetical protein